MSQEYELAIERVQQLRDWYRDNEADRNEATTRAHLIDVLIYDVLGWDRHSVTSEDHSTSGYSDYTFNAPRPVLIMEAKREGTYFEIPLGTSRRVRGLKSLRRGNDRLNAAVAQVARYCQNRGVPYATVCNGHQLVSFVATRLDATPPLDGRALVFKSLDEMSEHFLELWQHLSPHGIAEDRLRSTLFGDSSPDLPPKLAATIRGYPGAQQRNVLQTDLQILSELVLEDITRNRDIEPTFLQECYCPSGALSQYSLLSKRILQTRYAALHHPEHGGPTTIQATDKRGISPDLLADSLSRRPILLIGDVGVGKTAFWRHLMLVESAELASHSVVLYIDFAAKATLSADLRAFLIEEITGKLGEEYDINIAERNFIRGVYNLEVIRFKTGLYGDLRESEPELYRLKEIKHLEALVTRPDEHLRRSLEHIVKGRKKQVIIFIDNTDQRSEQVQQEAFLISQEIAENWPATVFVALRPTTFHESQRRGTLSGYHPKAFTISPPRIDLVLEKRLTFALKLTRGEVPVSALDENISVKVPKLESVLKVILRSVTQNRALLEAIDNIASGNVRRALDLVKDFLGSGHVDTGKILAIEDSGGSYVVPLHEFERAVIHGETEYYDPSRSPIANLFDVNHVDKKEHFLLPLLLALLGSPSAPGSKDGFVETAWIYDRLQGHGFTVRQINWMLRKAYRSLLLETEARGGIDSENVPSTMRITPVGAYHLQRLARHFTYVDAIIVDTTILEPAVRGNIQVVRSIGERLHRAERFRVYLDTQWERSGLGGAAFSWPEVSQALARDIHNVRARVGRLSG